MNMLAALILWSVKWLLIPIGIWIALAYFINSIRARKRDSLCIVLGSGGHTGEMLYMMLKYDFNRFQKVYCVVGDNDTLSIDKMKNFIVQNKVVFDIIH